MAQLAKKGKAKKAKVGQKGAGTSYVDRADLPLMNRGDAAAATCTFLRGRAAPRPRPRTFRRDDRHAAGTSGRR